MATAAKKPVSKTVASSAKKAAAKIVAPVKPATAPKSAAGKAAAKTSPAVKPAPASAQPKTRNVTAKITPLPDKTAAAATARTRVLSAKNSEPAIPTDVSKKPPKTMKTADTKSPVAKPAAKSAKAGKKISGIPQTDAELLAMPESDYMNDAQLAYFKAKLTLMRDEILENARETGEHLKENEVFADPNDRATVEEENLLEQRVRDRERKLLKKINASLVRIDEGEYGFCLETGDPIGLPRLLARPTAELSIEAQEKHERLEKLYAD